MDPEELSRRFGIPLRRDYREEGDGPVSMKVEYFKEGDRTHTVYAPDGAQRPLGMPIEELRREFNGNRGFVKDPFGNRHEITIPERLPNSKGIYVSISFTFRKKVPPTRRH